jgi:ActR/RegA family two-component response regulator
MNSIPATELAKLGKCEALIKPYNPYKVDRSFKRKEQKNQSSINRGNTAHDKFEAEARFFTKLDCNNKSIVPNFIIALAIAVGTLALISKVFI